MKNFFDHNINIYRKITPSLSNIEKLFKLNKNSYTADHVAFRTFKSCGGISIFHDLLKTEYDEMDSYKFPSKKVKANWYKPKTRNLPRIFLSEIDDSLLSKESQNIIKYSCEEKHYKYFEEEDPEHITLINYEDYTKLIKESEYAAWTLIHGSKINHIAISFSCLTRNISNEDLFSFQILNEYLKEKDFKLLEKGGIIKKSQDGLLLQSSTVSDLIETPFLNEYKKLYYDEIAGGFIEFVERKNNREGFESNNALNIFDSTSIINNKN